MVERYPGYLGVMSRYENIWCTDIDSEMYDILVNI